MSKDVVYLGKTDYYSFFIRRKAFLGIIELTIVVVFFKGLI